MKSLLYAIAAASVLGAVGLALHTANCGRSAKPSEAPKTPIERKIDGGARVLFVGAHDADILFAGPILARAGSQGMALTLGGGGQAFQDACDALGVSFSAAGFSTSAAVPGEPRIRTQDLKNRVTSRWAAGGRDPRQPILEAIESFRPDIIVTFDDDQGFTGDKEHRAVGQLVRAAIDTAPGPTHLYCVVNRFPRRFSAPIPTISRSQIVEIASSRTPLADGTTPYERAMDALDLFVVSGSAEAKLFPKETWERLLRETALVIAFQRDSD